MVVCLDRPALPASAFWFDLTETSHFCCLTSYACFAYSKDLDVLGRAMVMILLFISTTLALLRFYQLDVHLEKDFNGFSQTVH